MKVIGVQCAGALACNTKSKTGYFPQEKGPSKTRRGKGVSQQRGMKHKKCRVLPNAKRASDTLCMESDSCWNLALADAHARSRSYAFRHTRDHLVPWKPAVVSHRAVRYGPANRDKLLCPRALRPEPRPRTRMRHGGLPSTAADGGEDMHFALISHRLAQAEAGYLGIHGYHNPGVQTGCITQSILDAGIRTVEHFDDLTNGRTGHRNRFLTACQIAQ